MHCLNPRTILFLNCIKHYSSFQRKTAKDSNPRTEKRGPLVVEVMESCIVAHQHFAIRLLAWLNTAAQQFRKQSLTYMTANLYILFLLFLQRQFLV